jgi:hypothetical protein
MRSVLALFIAGLLAGCASVVVPLEKARVELAPYGTHDPAVLRERWGYLAAAEGKYLWPDDINAAPTFRRWIIPGAILEVDEYSGRESGHFNTYRYNPQTKAIDIFSWHSGERRGEARVNRDGSVSIDARSSATFTHSLSREGVHVVRNVFGAEWTWREIPKAQFLAQLAVLEEDRVAQRRRSSRETSNTLLSIAQGVVSAAGTATSPQGSPAVPQSSLPNRSVGQPAAPSRPVAATAPAQTPARASSSPGAGAPGSSTPQARRPASAPTRSDEADRQREVQQAERTRQEQTRRDQARQERAAREEAQRAETARKVKDYLLAVAKGSRLRTTTCAGGDGKYWVTGTRPRPKPEVVPCIDLHIRARCEGSHGSIPVVAGNFGAGAGCLGDTYAIEPKPACRIEDVRLQVVEARACGE